MIKLIYIYQNYTKDYSSASLSILRGLRENKKIETDAFEIRPFSYTHNINRIISRIPLLKRFHVKIQNKNLEKKVLSGKYDALFVMKGTDLKVDTLRKIKKTNPKLKLICFNPDNPFNKVSSNEDILSSIPLYDYYCIWTHHLNLQLTDAGAKKIIYLPFGIDNEIIYPVDVAYKYDISFIGNGDKERQKLIENLSIEVDRRKLNYKIHIFGNNWSSFKNNVIIHGQKNGKSMLETIAASRVNLNLLRLQNKNSINMRTFEIPGAGGFLIHEQSDEAATFFKPSQEMVFFDSITDLADKCDYYLKNEKEREIIIHNFNLNESKSKYSYTNLLETVFKQIFTN